VQQLWLVHVPHRNPILHEAGAQVQRGQQCGTQCIALLPHDHIQYLPRKAFGQSAG